MGVRPGAGGGADPWPQGSERRSSGSALAGHPATAPEPGRGGQGWCPVGRSGSEGGLSLVGAQVRLSPTVHEPRPETQRGRLCVGHCAQCPPHTSSPKPPITGDPKALRRQGQMITPFQAQLCLPSPRPQAAQQVGGLEKALGGRGAAGGRGEAQCPSQEKSSPGFGGAPGPSSFQGPELQSQVWPRKKPRGVPRPFPGGEG